MTRRRRGQDHPHDRRVADLRLAVDIARRQLADHQLALALGALAREVETEPEARAEADEIFRRLGVVPTA